MIHRFFFAILLSWTSSAFAEGGWVCTSHSECNPKSGASSKPANPSRGSRVQINPAAVPIENLFGIEALYYKSSFDFALVKGLGRVGAAISPSNNEETFFGPPSFELPESYATRKQNQDKYKSPKYTLATAMNLYHNGRMDITRIEVNVGVMVKYNQDTSAANLGGGVTGIVGPFTFGYSAYSDQTKYNYSAYGLAAKPVIKYQVETYSVGAFLSSLVVDYSTMKILTTETATVTVATASLFLRKLILIGSARTEQSSRPIYNEYSKSLENQETKNETFFGTQYRITPMFMAGVFYNYYLLKEISVGGMVFF